MSTVQLYFYLLIRNGGSITLTIKLYVIYSGCEVLRLKMSSVSCCVFLFEIFSIFFLEFFDLFFLRIFFEFFGCRLPVSMLIDHVICSWEKYSWADYMVQVAKNEMWASEVWFACLTWLYGLFVRTLISRTNAYAGCGRPTLNFIERFWLGSVRSASKLNSKCTQMNYEMNCITEHKYTEMHCNVL